MFASIGSSRTELSKDKNGRITAGIVAILVVLGVVVIATSDPPQRTTGAFQEHFNYGR